MTRTTCPQDHELLPIAAGEPADGAVSGHVSECPACRERVHRLAAEVRALRRAHAAVLTEPWPEPSATGGPAVGPGPGVPGGTEDWTSPDPTRPTADAPAAPAGGDPG